MNSEDEDDQDHYLARVKAEGEEKTAVVEEEDDSDSTDEGYSHKQRYNKFYRILIIYLIS